MQIVPSPAVRLEVNRHGDLYSLRIVGTSHWAACMAHELPSTLSLLVSDKGSCLGQTAARRWTRVVLGELG
jgi:hypothetical protein